MSVWLAVNPPGSAPHEAGGQDRCHGVITATMSLLDDDVVTSIESWPVIAWCLIDAGSYIWTIPVTANDDVNQIHVEGPYPWALLDVEGGIYTFRSGQRLPKDKDDNSAVRERLQAQLRRMRERENADR